MDAWNRFSIEVSHRPAIYYLAYGSNLSLERMAIRCPDAVVAGTAKIPGYRLLFKKSGSGFYATIEQDAKLYDVLTKGSGDAREQPLYFLITTAGTDRESICYELHMKALDILEGRKIDHTFYPVIYGLKDDEDWRDEKNWYKANPSLGQTIQIERVRDMYRDALDNPAEENVFKQLRLNLNMWVSSLTRFIPEHIYDLGNLPIDMNSLKNT